MIDGIIIKDITSNESIIKFGSIFYKNQHQLQLQDLEQRLIQQQQHSPNTLHSDSQQNQNQPILIQSLNHNHQLNLIAITHQDIEPSIILGFLNQFLQILKYQLNSTSLTPHLIQSNFLIILEIANFLINFHSLSSSNSSCFNLFDSLLPNHQSRFNQVFNLIQNSFNQAALANPSSITNSSSSSSSPNLKLSSIFNSQALPWRPIGLSYNQDEIYLDLIETLFLTVDHDSKILKSNLMGKINVDSKLSGMPEVLLRFKDFKCHHQLGFHQSIKYGKWKKDQTISFIPPNHSFTLLNYKSSSLQQSPLRFKPTITLGRTGGSFHLEIHSINQFNLSNLNLDWSLGTLCDGLLSDHVQVKSINSSRNPSAGGAAALNASWDWDPMENRFKVHVDLLRSHQSILIQGLWNHSSIENKPSPEISIRFEILPDINPNYSSLIGLKVDNLMLSNSSSNTNSNPNSTQSSRQNQHQHHLSKGIRTKLDQCRISLRW